MLIDSHAHLEMREFDRDREAVIRRAESAGVDLIITVGTTLDDCGKAISIAAKYKAVYAAIGIHPHEVKSIGQSTYDELKVMAKREKVVAFGEIGLDFFRNLSPRDVQVRRFGEQLELAWEIGLPIIIHDREAHRETLEMLKSWKGVQGGVVHCFSGDDRMARKCLDMGFHISIPGAVTFGKSDTLQGVVRNIPLTSLLLETDAPYLTPHPFRGKRNEPAYIIHTAQKVAEIKGLSFDELAYVTSQNTKNVFRIA
ncbi:MAG: TatD family deoxyribonuclease [Deltaproteobacteria bacterium]|nr:TatD family deoxyribonuclease [Deltaproteobacteria bacterium]